MRWYFLVLLQTTAILIGDGREANGKRQACVISSSGSVQVPWIWPQIWVTSWIPTRENHDPSNDLILEFKVHLTDEDGLHTHDTIKLHTNNVTISSDRNRDMDEFKHVDLSRRGGGGAGGIVGVGRRVIDGGGGWLNVSLEVKDRYILRRTGSVKVLFSSRPLKMHADVQEVIVTGSNLTLNCDTDSLIWRVSGTKAIMPLTPGGRGWRFTIFPTSSVVPKLALGGTEETITLGLDTDEGEDGEIDTEGLYPLRPFKYYRFIFECLSRWESLDSDEGESSSDIGVTCYLKKKSYILEEFDLPSWPRFLAVEGESAKPFYVLQKTVPLPYLPVGRAKTTRTTTRMPFTTTSAGSGTNAAVKMGWSGWWAALAVVLAFLLIFVIIMCFVSHYHRPKIERYLETMNLISEASQENLEHSPLPDRRPLLARSCSIVVDVEDPNTTAPLRLWNAVASGDLEEVEQVLATMTPDPEIMLVGWDTSPYEEAHRRGYHHILKVLDAFMSRKPQLPDNDMIISVMQSHARNVEAVFEAARGGQYRHGGGVDVLLRSFGLPGTVHDQHGQSLLHYAASVKLADGGPLWLAPDIRSLVDNHNVYVNAVDYRGQTALHALAEKASMSDQNTCWDGKAVNVREAWVNLAFLIMTIGCDPRLPDNSSLCPDDVAQMHGNIPLADKLAQERMNLGPINYSKCLSRYKDFLEALRVGNVHLLRELLREGVSVLPLGSPIDPLQEAIQAGHRDTVFLLLSAGASLCARGLIGDTPFEAAHNIPGLPALFPALIRRALCGQLEAEMQVIRGSNKIPDLLRKGSKDIKIIIERSGHKLGSELSKWMEERPADSSDDFNQMLATSASLGLTLICQLMGAAGFRLNPLPSDEQPLLLALKSGQHNTVYSLCRDLGMNPYSVSSVTDEEISERLKNDLLQSELITFEKELHNTTLDDVTIRNLLNEAHSFGDVSCGRTPTKLLLYLLAEFSLVSLIHQVRLASDDSILDSVVHEASGFTMLHIAAAYGRINMVEYLLSSGADYTCKTHSGLTSPHLAATRGHKECMKYIVDYTRHQEKWNSGVFPQHILKDFDENIKSYHLNSFPTTDLDAISKAKEDYTKTKLILISRCEKTGMTSEKALWETLVKEQKLIKDLITDDFIIAIECDICDFIRDIMCIDSRFKGTIVSRCPVFEKTEFFLPENFEFFCELEDYHALQGGCISIGKNVKIGGDGDIIDTVTSSKEHDFFNESNFKDAFYQAAKQALGTFTFKSLALVPPFLNQTSTGISISGILRKKSRLNLVQVVISPVLKVPNLPDNGLRKKYQNQLQFKGYEHLANTDDKKWVYLCNLTYKSVLSALSEDEQMVLWTCLYFSKLLRKCWWLPKKRHSRIGCNWQSYPIGVDFPEARTLVASFFDELMDSKEGSWKKENYLEKVQSILRRASPSSKRKVSFLDQGAISSNVNSVSAVLAFLDKISGKNLNEAQEGGLTTPKTYLKCGNPKKAISKNSLNVDVE